MTIGIILSIGSPYNGLAKSHIHSLPAMTCDLQHILEHAAVQIQQHGLHRHIPDLGGIVVGFREGGFDERKTLLGDEDLCHDGSVLRFSGRTKFSCVVEWSVE